MKTRLRPAMDVTPDEIDRRLAEGWYRVGQLWMTCTVLLNDTGLRSTVWTRVDLAAHAFKRSHRKLLNRLDRRFLIRHGPAVVDPTREALYQRYLTTTRGQRSPTLASFLWDDQHGDAFDTRELTIWEGDRLVGMSCYDVGATAMQSLIGIYDPDLSDLSLGFATVLLEIRQARQLGLRHHYTGYVLPGDPCMDYKLRPGAIEFLDKGGGWVPWDQLDTTVLPAEQAQARLDAAVAVLRAAGVRSSPVLHQHYRLRASNAVLFDQPLSLRIGASGPRELLLTWDAEAEHYRLWRTLRSMVRLVEPTPDDSPIPVWVVQQQRDVDTLDGLLPAVDRLRGTR